jgi:hypothetical protein
MNAAKSVTIVVDIPRTTEEAVAIFGESAVRAEPEKFSNDVLGRVYNSTMDTLSKLKGRVPLLILSSIEGTGGTQAENLQDLLSKTAEDEMVVTISHMERATEVGGLPSVRFSDRSAMGLRGVGIRGYWMALGCSAADLIGLESGPVLAARTEISPQAAAQEAVRLLPMMVESTTPSEHGAIRPSIWRGIIDSQRRKSMIAPLVEFSEPHPPRQQFPRASLAA